jgi:hypothetical protein
MATTASGWIISTTPLRAFNPPVAWRCLGGQLYSERCVERRSHRFAFWPDLAGATEVGTTLPLPTTLAGTTVKVKDAAGVERKRFTLFCFAESNQPS